MNQSSLNNSQISFSTGRGVNKLGKAATHYSTSQVLGRRGLERLDMLLLVIESLDLNGSQAMVWTSKKMGLDTKLPNAVEVWKFRCHNPLRKATRRGVLNSSESDSLILLVCAMSERLYPILRQLVSSKEPREINEERWNQLSTRLKDLVSERFNKRRGAVQALLASEKPYNSIRQLVLSLSLCAGSGGFDRLKASLHDVTI